VLSIDIMKTNKRNALAVSTLQAGGRFVRKLEPNFRGHLKFTTRLVDAHGSTVAGVGFATMNELRNAGLIDTVIFSGTFETWAIRSEFSTPAAAVAFDQAISQF